MALLALFLETAWPAEVPQAPTVPVVKKRLAVVDFDVSSLGLRPEYEKVLAESYTTALHQTGRFVLLERSELIRILQEHNLDMRYAMQAGSEAKVGRLLGAQILIKGTVEEWSDPSEGGRTISFEPTRVTIRIRAFDANTGEILETHESKGQSHRAFANNLSRALSLAMSDSVKRIVEKIQPVPWKGLAVSSEWNTESNAWGVYVNAGRDRRIPDNAYFLIHKTLKELIDPATSISLGFATERVGVAQAERVDEKFTYCRLLRVTKQFAEKKERIARSDVVEFISEGNAKKEMESMVEPPLPGPDSGLRRTIAVVIPETHIQRRIPDPAAETEIIRQLVAAGYRVVDQEMMAEIRYSERVLNGIRDPSVAVSIGRDYGADIVVVGEAFSETVGTVPPDLIACRARLEATGVDTHTARILGAGGSEATGNDIGETVAHKSACRSAAERLAPEVLRCIREIPANGKPVPAKESPAPPKQSVELLLTGISYAQLKEVEDALKKLEGVTAQRQSFGGQQARLIVEGIAADKLADNLSEQQFSSFRIEITAQERSKVEVKIVPVPPPKPDAGKRK